ncbi:LLM class flavin-dependent oxidoreductase [Actinokineospora sp. HUAS TT18]|uniref:LLM class flavin-dependent oxidoreductase n=1 Tax=Actinokineospora sp. HUAS TT18 TaxID=3447451 RepID=UPI003F51CECA
MIPYEPEVMQPPRSGGPRFGLLLEPCEDVSAVVRTVKDAERRGFDSVLIADHARTMSPFVSLAFIGEVTSSIKVGTYVVNAAFWRSPALLAREVRTIEKWVGNRVELGLGAGWEREDSVVAGNWASSAEVRAEHLSSIAAGLRTLPDGHRPAARVLMGGSSERSLALAARWADIVAFSGARRASDGSLELLSMGELRSQVDGVMGRIPVGACPELSLNVHSVTTEWWTGRDMPASVLAGSPSDIRRRVEDLRHGLGITYLVVPQADAAVLASAIEGLR